MNKEQLIEKFNPLNGSKLTAEDLETLRGLNDEQIDILANAYPNTPTRRAYLRLYDKNLAADKQLYQLSTWQNIRNLRKFSAKKNLIPYDFFTSAAAYNKANQGQAMKATGSTTSPKKKVVVDLTAKEAAAELASAITKPAGDGKQKTTPAKVVKSVDSVKKPAGKGKNKGAQESPADSIPDDQKEAVIE